MNRQARRKHLATKQGNTRRHGAAAIRKMFVICIWLLLSAGCVTLAELKVSWGQEPQSWQKALLWSWVPGTARGSHWVGVAAPHPCQV